MKKDIKSKAQYLTQSTPNWCPGCGNFGIWVGVKQSLTALGLAPHNVVLVGDIGCSGKLPYWTDVNSFAGLHGRAIPIAEGIKLANQDLTVIVISGDGGLLSEGLQHFVHACRRNINITVILHNNQLYGLTKGQSSATSEQEFKSSTTPAGSYEQPLNPALLAITSGASFVASSFAGNVAHMNLMIQQAVRHKGFSLLDIYQPCVTYNYLNTYEFYSKRGYDLEKTKYTATDRAKAIRKSLEVESGEKFPLGILYQNPTMKTLDEQLVPFAKSLASHEIQPVSVAELSK